MPLPKITQVTGTAVPVPGDDIDTDRIIPARFMKCVTFDGLGEYLFYDTRLDADGNKKDHPLNDSKYEGASILVSGNNFGCGSSREHAPQAIFRAGFKAVIAQGFAEIFFGNSTTLGMPCVSLSRDDLGTLTAMVEENPSLEIQINVENRSVTAGDATFSATIRDSAREGLINGKWDPMEELLEGNDEVDAVSSKLSYMTK